MEIERILHNESSKLDLNFTAWVVLVAYHSLPEFNHPLSDSASNKNPYRHTGPGYVCPIANANNSLIAYRCSSNRNLTADSTFAIPPSAGPGPKPANATMP